MRVSRTRPPDFRQSVAGGNVGEFSKGYWTFIGIRAEEFLEFIHKGVSGWDSNVHKFNTPKILFNPKVIWILCRWWIIPLFGSYPIQYKFITTTMNPVGKSCLMIPCYLFENLTAILEGNAHQIHNVLIEGKSS